MRVTLTCLLLCAAAPAAAQVSASVSVPVPSPYLPDWAVKPFVAQLTVVNGEAVNVTATVRAELVQGRGAIVGQAPSDIVDLPPSASSYFAPQMARWTEMVLVPSLAATVSKTGRLPEGPYTLCMVFTNMSAGGGPIPDVRSCSPTFNIAFPAPPVLVAPAHQSSVSAPFPTFQWTPVVTPTVPIVSYKLRVVEVLPGQTPLQAMDANVPLFEVTLPAISSFIYPPSAFPLEVDHTYAWRVQAMKGAPSFDEIPAPVGANDGKSEVFTFTRKTPGGPVVAAAPAAPPKPPSGAPSGGSKAPAYVGGAPPFNAMLSGTLRYTFYAAAVPEPKRLAPFTFTAFPLMQYTPQGTPASGSGAAGIVIGGQTTGGNMPLGGGAASPVAGVAVRLVVRYRSGTAPVTAPSVNVGGKVYGDVGKVVATATTGADGGFAFVFHDDHATGQIGVFTTVSWGSGDFEHHETNANVFRYYNLEVLDGHYLSPSDELTRDTPNVGTLVSLVRSYALRVRLVWYTTQTLGNQTYTLPAGTVDNAHVQLLRLVRPPTVPPNEGSLPPQNRPKVTLNLMGAGVTAEVIGQEDSKNGGLVDFTRLVKNVGPNDVYVIRAFTDSTQEGLSVFYHPSLKSYKNNWGIALGTNKPWDAAHYNEQYNTGLKDSIWLGMTPRPPRIAGRIERSDTKNPVAKGWALVTRPAAPATTSLPAAPFFIALRKVESNDQGRFVIDNVPEARQGVNYTILAGAQGFKSETDSSTGPKWGQIWHTSFQLDPDARIRARFVDENNKAVAAQIKIGGGAWINAKPTFQSSAGNGNVVIMLPTGYAVDTVAASGPQPQQVQFRADPGYFPRDTGVLIKPGMNDLGTVQLISRKRRVTLVVRRGSATSQISSPGSPPVAGAFARVDAFPGDSGASGADGRIPLEFTGAGTGNDNMINVFVRGPEDADYVPKTAICKAIETATPETCTVYLKPGTRVSGTVYAGSGTGAPVANARVFVPGQGALQVFTDAQGKYTLRRVPVNTKKLAAGKSASGLVGDLRDVTLQLPQTSGVDFHLTQYDDIDITQLLGFPLEVLEIATAPDGDGVIMSGALMAPQNPALAAEVGGTPQQTVALAFEDIRVRAAGGGSKAAVPDQNVVPLVDGELALRMYGTYKVRQTAPTGGLVVRPLAPGQGAVYGPLEVRRTETFATTSTGVTFTTPQGQDAPLFLLMPGASGAARTELPSLTAGAADPAPSSGFNTGSPSGGPSLFRINAGQGAQFNVEADAAQSFAKPDGVHFRSTIRTAIPGIGDLALKLADLTLQTGEGGVKAGASEAFQVKLHNWTLYVTGVSVSQAGVQFSKGEIRAPLIPAKPSSAIIFPFTGMTVLPTAISGGTLSSSGITLGGVVPFAPAGGLTFTREGSGPWKISAPGGTIAGLPGWGSQSLELDFWSIYSEGTPTFATPTGAKIRLYNTADLTIAGINPGDGIVGMGGSLDLLPPPEANIPPVSVILNYAKNAQGQVTPSLSGADWDEIDIGGPLLKISNGSLDASGFKSDGYIRIPNYFQVATNFTRTPLTGSNKLAAVPTPNASIAIGQLSLTQVKGGATLSSPWSTAFDALLDIPNQVGGELHFGVAGADVAVGTAGLKVSSISTPFGSVAIVLNMPEQRLEGSLEIDHEIATKAFAKGTAQLAISGKPSNRYWYFMVGADFKFTQPYMAGTAALLIGNATLPAPLLATFNQYSHRPLPAAFHAIKGFFLAGKAPPPGIECPDLEIDVGVASASAGCAPYADVRFGTDFENANTYFIGMGAGARVWAKGGVSLGVCVSVGGEVKFDAEFQGAYKSTGDWYVAGSGELSLGITVKAGVGAFDVCLEESSHYSRAVGYDMQIGYDFVNGDGEHFKFYWK